MSNYDPYEREYGRRHVREERREERDPRFLDTHYTRTTSSRDLIPRGREDSELSVEEIRRDFPPPTGRDIRRARSAEPYYDDDYDDYRRDYDRRSRKGPGTSTSSLAPDSGLERRKSKSRSMSKQEKIIAAVAGAALLAGGKELYDRREAKEGGSDVQRNALSSVALAGVGALAAYQGAEFYNKHQAKRDQKANYILHRGRDGAISDYLTDEDEDPKQKKGHKNFLESALAATGLGAAVKSFTGGGKDDARSDTRSRRGSQSPQGRGGANKVQKAAMASLLAGATEAFRVSKEPGGWKGEKAKRILTAAAGAATVDAAQDKDHGKLGMAESVIGGLVGNRLIRGSKNDIEEDGKGRSRSRSRARSEGGGGSGLAALATAGLGAFGAKKAYDSHRSKSRGRSDSRGSSRSPSRRRSRSRSVVDKARNGLAKLGIGAGAGAGALTVADDERRRNQDDFDDRGSRRPRRYSDDTYDDDYDRPRRGGRDRDYYYDDDEDDRSRRGGSRRDRSRGRGNRSEYAADSDLGDSSEDEKRAKKMRGKQILTTGLAAVATIHAAHNVYQSMEKRNARAKAVREGRLSPAEAKKLKTKAMLQDAASIGIATLGIKGAVDELKEARHITHECKEFHKEKEHRHAKREEKRQLIGQVNGAIKKAETWAPRARARLRNDSGSDDDDDGYYALPASRGGLGPRRGDGNSYRSSTLPPPPLRNPGER